MLGTWAAVKREWEENTPALAVLFAACYELKEKENVSFR